MGSIKMRKHFYLYSLLGTLGQVEKHLFIFVRCLYSKLEVIGMVLLRKIRTK